MYLCKPVLVGVLLAVLVTGGNRRFVAIAQPATADPVAPGTTAPRQAVGGKAAADRPVYLNFKNADILQIVNLISELTGKNFLVDEQVKGKITIVAPNTNCSGASNSLTLDAPIRIHEVDEDVYRVSGTPTDCVHIALTGMLEQRAAARMPPMSSTGLAGILCRPRSASHSPKLKNCSIGSMSLKLRQVWSGRRVSTWTCQSWPSRL